MMPRRKYVARHEAGHAVAALVAYRALGWPPSLLRSATVIEAGEIRGAVEGLHTYAPQPRQIVKAFATNAEVCATLVPQCKWAIVVSLAGVEADAKLSRVSGAFAAIRGGQSDYEFAKRALADLSIMTRARPSMEPFERLAKSIVRLELPAIRAVADALHEFGTMTGAEMNAKASPHLSSAAYPIADI